MEKSKKKVKEIIIWIVFGLVAIVGLVSAFLLNYNSFSPSAPVVLDDGTNIYISTTFNDNYQGYRFKFSTQDKEIIVDSEDNVVDANEVVSEGGSLGEVYNVSVCYLAQNSGNNSEYSEEIEWICQTYLPATTIAHDTVLNKLVWGEVDGADYYRVYYNNAEDEFFLETTELSLDLQQFVGGEKIMYVIAYSKNAHIKQSGKSNLLEFKLQHYFKEFSNLSFDKKSKLLTAENEEKLEKIEISLNGDTYLSIKFNVEEKVDIFVYTIDLTAIYNNESNITIKPANIDEFNVFVGNGNSIIVS